jgi:hypothetical protein
MRWFNVITLFEVLAKFLDGEPLENPQLNSFFPVRGLLAQIDQENATRLDALVFLGL